MEVEAPEVSNEKNNNRLSLPKKPLSAYMIFTMDYRSDNPT